MPFRKSNVLFIICDQMSAKMPSCYGGWLKTPNIDRLAAEGVRFTNAVSTCPMCSPARASIITGMYPHSNGILHNVSNALTRTIGEDLATEVGISDTDTTTEKLLHEAGYQTHHYGKWHLSADCSKLSYYPDMFRLPVEYMAEMTQTFKTIRGKPKNEWYDFGNMRVWPVPTEVRSEIQKTVASPPEYWLKKNSSPEEIIQMGKLMMTLEETFDYQSTALLL